MVNSSIDDCNIRMCVKCMCVWADVDSFVCWRTLVPVLIKAHLPCPLERCQWPVLGWFIRRLVGWLVDWCPAAPSCGDDTLTLAHRNREQNLVIEFRTERIWRGIPHSPCSITKPLPSARTRRTPLPHTPHPFLCILIYRKHTCTHEYM